MSTFSHEKFYLFIDAVQLTTKVIDKENGGIEVSIYDMLNELKAYKNLTLLLSSVAVLPKSMYSLCPLRNSTLMWAVTSELYVKDIVERNGIEREDIPHSFYDDNGIFHCNLIDLLLGRVELF